MLTQIKTETDAELQIAYKRWKAKQVKQVSGYTHWIDISIEYFTKVTGRSLAGRG